MCGRRNWVKAKRLESLTDESQQLTRIIAKLIITTRRKEASSRRRTTAGRSAA